MKSQDQSTTVLVPMSDSEYAQYKAFKTAFLGMNVFASDFAQPLASKTTRVFKKRAKRGRPFGSKNKNSDSDLSL